MSMRPPSQAGGRRTAMSTPLPGSAIQPEDERHLTFKPSQQPWVRLLTDVNDNFKSGCVVQIYKVQGIPYSPTQYVGQPVEWQHTDSDTLYRFQKRFRKTTYITTHSSETKGAVHHNQLLMHPRGAPGPDQYDSGVGQVYYLKVDIRVLYKGKWIDVPMNTGVTINTFTSISGGRGKVLATNQLARKYYVVNCYLKTEKWHYEPCRTGMTVNSFEQLQAPHTQKILRKQLNADPIVVSADKLTAQQREAIPEEGSQLEIISEEVD